MIPSKQHRSEQSSRAPGKSTHEHRLEKVDSGSKDSIVIARFLKLNSHRRKTAEVGVEELMVVLRSLGDPLT